MSVVCMTRVLKHSKQVKSAKHLLMMIAWHAHDDGTGAWAGQKTLADETGYTDRQIRTLLRKLERSGELRIRPRPGTTALMTVLVQTSVSTPGAPAEVTSAPPDEAGVGAETSAHPGSGATESTETSAHPGEELPTNPYLTVTNLQRTVPSEDAAAAGSSLRSTWRDGDEHRRNMRVADELARDASPRVARGGRLRPFAEIVEERIARRSREDRAAP